MQAYVKRIQYILWHHILIHFPFLQKTISVFTGTYKTLLQRNCRRKGKIILNGQRVFQKDPEEEFYMLPQAMLHSLPVELSNLLSVSHCTLHYLRSLLKKESLTARPAEPQQETQLAQKVEEVDVKKKERIEPKEAIKPQRPQEEIQSAQKPSPLTKQPSYPQTKGKIIRVPQDYDRISLAIRASKDGDQIIVSPGVYREGASFESKKVILRSVDPSDPNIVKKTVLDPWIPGLMGGSTVSFENCPSKDMVFAGFTIPTTKGIGIRILNLKPA